MASYDFTKAMSHPTMKVHPVAELFPMLGQEELEELAADIREQGLLHPIALDQDGQVLDGRNRLKACELAGVEPVFTTYTGEDAARYALAANIARRHLSKGQQAMILVKAGGLFQTSRRELGRSNGISNTRLNNAALVQSHAPELVEGVVSGIISLDAAYRTAHQRKAEAEEIAKRAEGLRRQYADLEDRVKSEEMSLAEAFEEAARRQRQAEEDQRLRDEQVRRASTKLAESVQWLAEAVPQQRVLELFDQSKVGVNYQVTPESLRKAIAGLERLLEVWP